MKLIFLVTNNAWAFAMDDSLVRLNGEALFFRDRRIAVQVARQHDIFVEIDGGCFAGPSDDQPIDNRRPEDLPHV